MQLRSIISLFQWFSPGRNLSDLFLSGYWIAAEHNASFCWGDTCSSTYKVCSRTLKQLLFILWPVLYITLNCVWSGVALSAGSNLLSFFIAALKLAELISVSPHVTDSSIASWRKMYWSYTNENNNTPLILISLATYRCLDHLHALVPHLVDCSCNVHHLLLLDLLQDTVNTDEGTSTSNTSTVCMDNHLNMCINWVCTLCTCNVLVLVPCWSCVGR